MKEDEFIIELTGRGYIQYSVYYYEINETQFGIVKDKSQAKVYSRVQANRILRILKKQNQEGRKIKWNN